MARLEVDPAAWASLNRLLDQGLALSPADREAWLEGLPAIQAPLVTRLRRLLDGQAAPGADRFLVTIPKLSPDPSEAPPGEARRPLSPGDRIGPWRLDGLVAEGGMGTVWRAERADSRGLEAVALKLPRGAWRRADLCERLAREREFLAALDHPNVARLRDAGMTQDGQPWLAIEWVDGLAIDRYARQAGLDVRARVRLLLQVAAAVAHAHARLVVHRDLKPSNVLVTAEGQVRLIDFGIAKLLEGGLALETELTRLGGRALTPAYAAPEQLEGGPIGVGVDVHALGVLLFVLLAEAHPYRPERDTREALEAAILGGEVRRPSEAAADPLARRALRGDLDTVILRAMKRRPEDRYPTVHALAEDLERWLAGRPVAAQPDRLLYRLRKLVGRHRVAAGASAAVALAILAGAGLVLREKARTDAARVFIASMKPDVDLEAAERAFLRAAREGRGPADPRLMETRLTYGRALAEVGRPGEALEQLTQAERDATARFGADSLLAALVTTGRSLTQLEAGLLPEGVAASGAVMRVFERLTRPDTFPYVAALHRLGEAHLAARDPARALPALTRGAEGLGELLGTTHQRTLVARAERALALAQLGRLEEADREAAGLLDLLPPASEPTGTVQHLLGAVRRLSGDPARALQLQRAALTALRPGAAGDGPRMRELAEAGLAEVELGAWPAAEATLGEALALQVRRQLRVTPERADVLLGLGRARLGRGDARAALGPLEEAERFWSRYAPGGAAEAEVARWLDRCRAALAGSRAVSQPGETGRDMAEPPPGTKAANSSEARSSDGTSRASTLR